jgi:hypothetical protein
LDDAFPRPSSCYRRERAILNGVSAIAQGLAFKLMGGVWGGGFRKQATDPSTEVVRETKVGVVSCVSEMVK